MTAVVITGTKFRAWDDNGVPLAFGKVFTFQAGTNNPKATYTSEEAITANANPVILNGQGYADICLSGSYKIVVEDQLGNIIHTTDPVTDPGSLGKDWVNEQAATQISPTEFKVTGNLTDVYVPGRALQLNDASVIYGYVDSSVYLSGETLVTVDTDIALTNQLNKVSVGVCRLESLPNGGYVISGSKVNSFPTMNDLPEITVGSDGAGVTVTDSNHGGPLTVRENLAKTMHDGVRYFDPSLDLTALGWGTNAAAYVSANAGTGVYERPKTHDITVLHAGAMGVDDSVPAAAMLTSLNRLVSPKGFTLVINDIELFDNTYVDIQGTAKLKSGAVDFARMFYADAKSGINIDINELDGNSAGQSGVIGTHLVYLTNCIKPVVNIKYVHDHYYQISANLTGSIDGIRDASSGAIFFYKADRAQLNVGLLENWGREGIQFRESTRCEAYLGHAQGSSTGGEYSALQMAGTNNKILRASCDSAGASGIGFDTAYGEASNLLSTNTRANHGVNIGHPGFPATGSVINNVVVDGAKRNGIGVAASSQDVQLSNYVIRNCGEYGLSASDGVLRLNASNGLVEYSAIANINATGSEIEIVNTGYSTVDTRSLKLSSVTGVFSDGETVTGGTSGATGVIRKTLLDRIGANVVTFINTVTGVFAAGETVSGGTSLATGVIDSVYTPAAKNEALSGLVIDESNLSSGGLGTVTKYKDGTAIYRHSITIAATAATLETVLVSFPDNISWLEAPQMQAGVYVAVTTDAYEINRISCDRTTANYTVKFQATATQTYGIDIIAIGTWR